jgi:hypothetical protein
MAIKQSPWALFKQTAARPLTSGAVTKQEFYYDASAGLLAADIVDLGVLPANAKIHDAYLYADASIGTVNATVGIMSGELGSTDSSRTLGSEIFNGSAITNAHTALVRLTSPAATKLAAGVSDRSIGLQVSADVAAGAGKIIRLVVEYTL